MSSAKPEAGSKPIATSKNAIQIPLFSVWFLALSAISGWTMRSGGSSALLRALLSRYAFTWSGMLLAISFTTSWAKFRAPLVEKHVALDVGRHEFTALGSIEAAFAVVSLGLLGFFDAETPNEALWRTPAILTVIVMFQVFYLTPALERRAFSAIADALENKPKASRQEEAVFKYVKAVMTLNKTPSVMLHHLFVGLEALKLGLLIKYGVELSSP